MFIIQHIIVHYTKKITKETIYKKRIFSQPTQNILNYFVSME